jgi:hypothetical protein
MITGTNNCVSDGGEIYTLVESGTHNKQANISKAFVSGKGTDIINNPSLKNRAKRKVITRKMILALIDVVKEKGEPERQQAYWNTFYCQSSVIISGNKLYGDYCKNRFCTICCAIRKADTINRYYPYISQWEDVHFVTLTVKACKADKLNRWIGGMYKAFELIHNRCKKRHQRGKGIKLIGIKSLECNFNPVKKTYNPHFHIIVPGKKIADLLVKEWLEQWRPENKSTYRYKFTSPKAQKISKVTNLEHSLIETIKYGSKIFTEPDLKKKSKQSIPPMIYAYALDNILVAMKGKRIFDRFGFNLPPQPTKKNTSKLVENYENWLFPDNATDWINTKTGESLTGYFQPIELSFLLNECINIQDY